eukprot:TRINITY_DN74773_c0_g1_i1.p1 TRINITY_DN74773_c0_g1~~TRINITY_DN74773_c0_g1_i1.p1  ORF type:complete len:329 (-),score=48.49 TRINITY_DN74773_c0_g1_i1:85-999(-)
MELLSRLPGGSSKRQSRRSSSSAAPGAPERTRGASAASGRSSSLASALRLPSSQSKPDSGDAPKAPSSSSTFRRRPVPQAIKANALQLEGSAGAAGSSTWSAASSPLAATPMGNERGSAVSGGHIAAPAASGVSSLLAALPAGAAPDGGSGVAAKSASSSRSAGAPAAASTPPNTGVAATSASSGPAPASGVKPVQLAEVGNMHCSISTDTDPASQIRTKVFRMGAPLLRSTIPVSLGRSAAAAPGRSGQASQPADDARRGGARAPADDEDGELTDEDVETVLSLSDVEFENQGHLSVTLDFPC